MRDLHTVVISDTHLGTFGLHAEELLKYLKSINPRILILNGDIIDMWAFKKRYFPKEHLEIIYELMQMIERGTTIYYLPGNHDDLLRKFTDFSSGNFHLRDKLVLMLNGKRYWFFHGDVFDVSVNYSRWIAKLGGKGYDLLIRINRFMNLYLKKMGKEPYSFSKKIKDNVKNAVKFITDFEHTVMDLAIEDDCDYVVCGHIHTPVIKKYRNDEGEVIYMNSGDWIENLTALEYNNKEWKLFRYSESEDKTPKYIPFKEEIGTFVD